MAGNTDALRDLPVPISGTHATGKAPGGAAQEAARLLYFARLIANTAKTFRRGAPPAFGGCG